MTDHITIPRALLEQALEALELRYAPDDILKIDAAKTAIRAELAKPQADPVAASGEDLEIYREMANNYFKSTTPQHDAPEVAALKAELERAKDDHQRACGLVADMHAAAVGEITGPRLGVVEDVAALKAQRDELLKAVEAVDDLIQHSHGVVGLHLNGDVAPWSELQTGGCNEGWLIDFDAAIAKAEGSAL